jgi:sortase A
MRRALQILSVALITAGAVILVDVGMTLAWKEPLSTIYASIQQARAEDSLDQLVEDFNRSPGRQEAIATPDRRLRTARLARAFADQVHAGQGIGRISIPGIGLDIVFVQGTDTSSLQKGPGHYPETAFPGEGRTVAIAGHRTTYLAPFRNINEIADGDEIALDMPYGTFTYQVQKHRVVDPDDVQIVHDVGYERLVLTACHPLYSAAHRWAVFAKLVRVTDVPSAGTADARSRASGR